MGCLQSTESDSNIILVHNATLYNLNSNLHTYEQLTHSIASITGCTDSKLLCLSSSGTPYAFISEETWHILKNVRKRGKSIVLTVYPEEQADILSISATNHSKFNKEYYAISNRVSLFIYHLDQFDTDLRKFVSSLGHFYNEEISLGNVLTIYGMLIFSYLDDISPSYPYFIISEDCKTNITGEIRRILEKWDCLLKTLNDLDDDYADLTYNIKFVLCQTDATFLTPRRSRRSNSRVCKSSLIVAENTLKLSKAADVLKVYCNKIELFKSEVGKAMLTIREDKCCILKNISMIMGETGGYSSGSASWIFGLGDVSTVAGDLFFD